MTVKEELERLEHQRFNPRAAFADCSRGRLRPEPEREGDVRTCFQRDTDRIVHSKAFRRLMHKTQVFLSPEGDHYRTRMTHTLEVARIARTITRSLGLNEDLAEAIAMGHDLGHTPFGHAGERTLDALMPGGFSHNRQSLRVADVLERDGMGLNLTWEVRNGILCHTQDPWPETLEGMVVRRSDQIAYVNHDIDDALRAGILREEDLPKDVTAQELTWRYQATISGLKAPIPVGQRITDISVWYNGICLGQTDLVAMHGVEPYVQNVIPDRTEEQEEEAIGRLILMILGGILGIALMVVVGFVLFRVIQTAIIKAKIRKRRKNRRRNRNARVG